MTALNAKLPTQTGFYFGGTNWGRTTYRRNPRLPTQTGFYQSHAQWRWSPFKRSPVLPTQSGFYYAGQGWRWIPIKFLSAKAIAAISAPQPEQITNYYLRGWDSGGQFVFWSSVDVPDVAPASTVPAVVGTLGNVCVVGMSTICQQ